MTATEDAAPADRFATCRDRLEAIVGWLCSTEATAMSHGEVEARLETDGRELLRLAYQGHLDTRAGQEARMEEVVDATGVPRRSAEAGHERTLTTLFGEVRVRRIAYRQRGQANLHPADGVLNLPEEKHSHGLRALAAVESSRGSFDGAVEAIERATGQQVAKRQVEGLASRVAADFEEFYARHHRPPEVTADVLVLSADGKGIVMRPGALRPATAAAAAKATTKLDARLSKGEKRNRKRMAEVGAVYDAAPAPRSTADILPADDGCAQPAPAPAARNKWLVASVVDDAASVVGRIFDEAERRDPEHNRAWVALVDGNNHQIERIRAEAKTREVTVAVVCDFVHVLEYIWRAAWSFFDEGDAAAEAWVREKALAVLSGGAGRVAGAIRCKATALGLSLPRRANADACAKYLTNKRPYLDYPTALERGWPIATGVIEGACRHIVKDRMDITGARWGLEGAEAVLKLRALRANGDFEEYLRYHLSRERQRVHEARYADNVIPEAA